MGNEKSKSTGISDGLKKLAQILGPAKDTSVQLPVNIRMVQNVVLIWLDSNIDEKNNDDCRNTITQLRCVVNNINTFTNGDECIEFIETIDNEKACMIISGSLGQDVVPRVHDMFQVDSIYIFCSNKIFHEQWAQAWPKIKGVFTEITPVCEALKDAAFQYEHDAIVISFMDTVGDLSTKKLDKLGCSFMYTQILQEILLSITFEQKNIDEYIEYCQNMFVGNNHELDKINKFQSEYRNHTPIWWYTSDCFLYPMLNRVLRMMEVDIIMKMGFFIADLHRQIEELHSKQFSGHHASRTSFTVYRGQGLSKVDFEQMTKTKGGLIAFNNFLSTSKNYHASLSCARRALSNSGSVGVLFVMTIDPSHSTTPFTSMKDVSFSQDKDNEVLFSMHAVFRIHDIEMMEENAHLVQVNLTLIGHDAIDLRILTDRLREDTFPDEKGWYRLGSVLFKIGQSDKAQQVYQVLLEQATKEDEKAAIYHALGLVMNDQGEYEGAIKFYEKSLAIKRKSLASNDLDLAISYNNIGGVYQKVGEYSKARVSLEKALTIRKQSLLSNSLDLADSYDSIGLVYDSMGESSKARSSYDKARAIKKQLTLPSD